MIEKMASDCQIRLSGVTCKSSTKPKIVGTLETITTTINSFIYFYSPDLYANLIIFDSEGMMVPLDNVLIVLLFTLIRFHGLGFM